MRRGVLARPPCLKRGDRVRLIAPASPFDDGLFEAGRKAIEGLGRLWAIDRRLGQAAHDDPFQVGGDWDTRSQARGIRHRGGLK